MIERLHCFTLVICFLAETPYRTKLWVLSYQPKYSHSIRLQEPTSYKLIISFHLVRYRYRCDQKYHRNPLIYPILVGYILGAYILEENHFNLQSVKLINFLSFFPDFAITSSHKQYQKHLFDKKVTKINCNGVFPRLPEVSKMQIFKSIVHH